MYYIYFRIRGLCIVATTVATIRDRECTKTNCTSALHASLRVRVHKCRPWILTHVFAICGKRSFTARASIERFHMP